MDSLKGHILPERSKFLFPLNKKNPHPKMRVSKILLNQPKLNKLNLVS